MVVPFAAKITADSTTEKIIVRFILQSYKIFRKIPPVSERKCQEQRFMKRP